MNPVRKPWHTVRGVSRDFFLVHDNCLSSLRDVYSNMDMAFASHHFPLVTDIVLEMATAQQNPELKHVYYSLDALKAVEVCNSR